MKTKILMITLFAIAFALSSFPVTVDAQKIARRCEGSSKQNRVELTRTSIILEPCPNGTVEIYSGGSLGGGGNGQGLAGYTVTNTDTDRTLNPNDSNFSIAELANVTGTVIKDLQTTGILNAITPSLFELSDESTTLSTGLKKTVRLPSNFTLLKVRAGLTTSSTTGAVVVDIRLNGSSILGNNKLSIDATENTSTTAAAPVVIATSSLADDNELTFYVTSAGTGASGLKVWLVGRYAN